MWRCKGTVPKGGDSFAPQFPSINSENIGRAIVIPCAVGQHFFAVGQFFRVGQFFGAPVFVCRPTRVIKLHKDIMQAVLMAVC